MVDLLGIDSKKVYALVRVSSDKQDFQSQMQGIQSYCRSNHIELLEENIIQEHNVSGYKTEIKNRKGLQRILELSKAKKLKMLIVFNQDRLARKTEIINYINQLTKLGVLIVSVTEGIINDTTSDTSDLIYMIKSWTAKYESQKTSKRVRSGKLSASKQGRYNGGKVLLGYKVINGKLVIDETKAPIIKMMYEKYIQGGSKLALEYLESVGIKKVHQSLLQLIKNPQYKGYQQHDKSLYTEAEYNEIMFFNPSLAIVSEEVWNRANQLRLARKTNRRGCNVLTNRTKLLLEGICYCATCGGKLTLQRDYRYNPPQYILQCRKCKQNKEQSQKNWSYNKIERLVNENLEQILDYEIDKEKLEKYYNSKKNSNISELEQILEIKNKELNNKNRAISKANSNLEKMLSIDLDIDSIKIVTNTISKLKSEAEELKQQISELEQQINQEMMINKESNNKIRMLLEIKKLYAKASDEQQKKLLQLLVNRIEVKNKDDVKIYLNY